VKNRFLTKEFTIALPSGKTVTAEVETEWAYESSYGADADGNRGVGMTTMEDHHLVIPVDDPRWELDDQGYPLTEIEKFQAEKLLLNKAYDDEWAELGDLDDSDF
jgi:hypothetical protein